MRISAGRASPADDPDSKLSEPQACLMNLPPELHTVIVDKVLRRQDILALALTCRSFYNVCVPAHTECRTLAVRGHDSDPWLWTLLSLHPAMASNVRKLVIAVPNGFLRHSALLERFAGGVHPLSGAKGFELFASALAEMPRLVSLTWKMHRPGAHRAVWETLAQRCRLLRELHVREPMQRMLDCDDEPLYGYRHGVFALQGLEALSLVLVHELPDDFASCLTDFLARNPKLDYLHLFSFHNIPHQVFDEVFLPRLTDLAFDNVTYAEGALHRFFTKHPNISRLNLDMRFLRDYVFDLIRPRTLPALQVLKMRDHDSLARLLSALAADEAPVESVGVVNVGKWESQMQTGLVAIKNSLRVVHLHGNTLDTPQDVKSWFDEKLPQVQVAYDPYEHAFIGLPLDPGSEDE